MKPNWLDQKEYERLVVEGRKALVAEKMPNIPQLVDVAASGQWLWDELQKLGLDEEKMRSVSFAHGQACFPAREPWETARVILSQAKTEHAPAGGAEYGDALLNGMVKGLPPGGMQIVKVGVDGNDETLAERPSAPFCVGQTVKATRQITEGGSEVIGDKDAVFPAPSYIHAELGEPGKVVHTDGDGTPTVAFERTKTATIVALDEIE